MIGFEQSPRYAELIRRVFGEDAELLPPGIFLELDRPEWRIFKREFDWTTGRLQIAAAAGNLGHVQIQVLPLSARIVVPTTIFTLTATASSIAITIDGPVLAAPVPNLALDTRQPFAAGPGAPQVNSQNAISNAAGGVGGYKYAEFGQVAGIWTRFDFPRPPVLVPGHNLTVWDQAVNEQLAAYILGYERPAEPEELAP